MQLMTGQYSLKWNKELSKHTFFVLADNSSVENNTNYGGRKIIPDAWMAENALSVYMNCPRFNASVIRPPSFETDR